MANAIVTSRGQVTIPATIRASLGLKPGATVEFVRNKKGQYVIVPATGPLVALRGILRKPRKPVSVEEMDQGIMEEVSKRYR